MVAIRRRKNKPRKNGSIKISWQLDYVDNSGERHRPQFETRTLAERARNDVLLKLQQDRDFGSSGKQIFREAAYSYLNIIEKIGRNGKPPLEPETVNGYRRILEIHVLPEVGDVIISDIRAPDVVAFRDWLLSKSKLGNRTAKNAFLQYRGVLQEAFNRGKVQSNVWSGITISNRTSRPVLFDEELGAVVSKIPSNKEIAKLLETAERLRRDPRPLLSDHKKQAAWQKYSPTEGPRGWKAVQTAWQKYYPILLTAVFTGMRQGEIRALKWDSYKPEQGVIFVRHAASNAGRIKGPKSAAGYRAIDIPKVLEEELNYWRGYCTGSELVFPNESGNVISKENLHKRMWKRLLEWSGVSGYTFHSLRHHYASLLIQQDFSPKEIQQAMGHADIQTTFNIYGHLFPEDRSIRKSKIEKIALNLLEPSREAMPNNK
jgi:integrase